MDLTGGMSAPELAVVAAGFGMWAFSIRHRCRECGLRTTGMPTFAWRGPRCRTCHLPLKSAAAKARSRAHRRRARARA